MDTNVTSFDELISMNQQGPKVSVYLPLSGAESQFKIFCGLRDFALRLLRKSGDEALMKDFADWAGKIAANLGDATSRKTVALFFAGNFRRILFLDHELPPRVIVSESFHVKPLLFAKSEALPGYFLEFHHSGVTVWGSTGVDLEVVDHAEAPISDTNWPSMIKRKHFIDYLHNIAASLPEGSYVHISGAPEGIARSLRFWSDYVSDPYVDAYRFGNDARDEARMKFLSRLKLRHLQWINEDLSGRLRAPGVTGNPEEVLKGIRENRFSRLYVSLEALRWGRIDEASGLVTYHRMQTDHRDEDVLDDLAELALRKGIDVRVVKQVNLPKKMELVAS